VAILDKVCKGHWIAVQAGRGLQSQIVDPEKKSLEQDFIKFNTCGFRDQSFVTSGSNEDSM
jgi:hypothetical protein